MSVDDFSDEILKKGLEHVATIADADPLVRDDLVEGQYLIEARIGSGGFGHVYKARDLRASRRPVALKVLRPELLQQYEAARILRLFAKEAYTAMHLQHPNIVVVHARGNLPFGDVSLPFMVMEFLQGMTLADHLSMAAPLDPSEAVLLAQQILSALACAHSQDVLHLDIKPGNIMVRDEQIKLLDFGLARLGQGTTLLPIMPESERGDVEALLRQRLSRGGTYEFLPPEQRASDARDVATDLWGTAMTLWQMLTGYLPAALGAPTFSQTAEPGNGADWNTWLDESLAEMVSGPPALRQVLRRAMDRHPAARFSSAHEFQGALLRSQSHRSMTDAPTPYYHLAPFNEDNATVFFGRERSIVQLKKHLRVTPFFTILGISGAGKSSVVGAGLIPHLRADGWFVMSMAPGDDPLGRLARLVLARRAGGFEQGLSAQMPEQEQLSDIISAALYAWINAGGQQILLFIDQFEELYTRSPAKNRLSFCELLLSLADDYRSPFRVLIALRDDYRPRLAELPALARVVAAHHLYLDPPDEVELREALEQPAALAGFRYEPELLDRILNTVHAENPLLPILQLIASRSWQERDATRGIVPAHAFQENGLGQVLADHANAALSRLPDAHQRRLAKTLLCQLVTEQGTRREAILRALVEDSGEAMLATLVLRQLEHERLISIREQDGQAIVQLSHDLLTAWPQLRTWLMDAPAWRALRSRLQAAALQWEGNGKPDALLWNGQRLQDLLHGMHEYNPAWSPLEQDFIRRSRRRQFWRYLGLLSSFLAVVVLAAVMGSLWRLADRRAVAARQAEERERMTALRERGAAEQARKALEETEKARTETEQARQNESKERIAAIVSEQKKERALQIAKREGQRATDNASRAAVALDKLKQEKEEKEKLAVEKWALRRQADIEEAGNLLEVDPKGSLRIITRILADSADSANAEILRILQRSLFYLLKGVVGGRGSPLESCDTGISSAAWGTDAELLLICESGFGVLRAPGHSREVVGLNRGEKGVLAGSDMWTSDGRNLWRWAGNPLRREWPAMPLADSGRLQSLHVSSGGRHLLLRYRDPDRFDVVDMHHKLFLFSEIGYLAGALSSDGRLLALGNKEGKVLVHDLLTRQDRSVFDCSAPVKTLAFHPLLQRLLVGCAGRDRDTGTEVGMDSSKPIRLPSIDGRLVEALYSPDGGLLLLRYLVKHEWELAVYRMVSDGLAEEIPLFRFEKMSRARFSSDGRWLLLGNGEHSWLLPLRLEDSLSIAKALLHGTLPTWPWSSLPLGSKPQDRP